MRYRMRAAGLAAMCGFTAAANAETLRWIGPPGGSWTEPGHWSPAQVPSEGDRILFEVDGQTAIDFDYPALDARSATFRAGTTRLLGETIFEVLRLREQEPVNPPALTVADTPGVEAVVEGEVSLHAPSAAIGVEGRGVWSTEAEMWLDDLFIGVRPDASGVVSLRGQRAQLRRRFTDPGARVTVGFEGDGLLEFRDGATAEITELRLGVEPGSHGEILVDGDGSVVSFDEITLGGGSATIATRNGGAVQFPENYWFRDVYGAANDTLTFDAVQLEGLHEIYFMSGRTLALRSGAVVRVNEYVHVGGLDLRNPSTRLMAKEVQTTRPASVTEGAAIEISPEDRVGLADGFFRGGLEIDGGRVTLDRIAETGRGSLLAVGSLNDPPDQLFRLVNGAVLETEGVATITFFRPSEMRGAGTTVRQRTQLISGFFQPDPRPVGELWIVARSPDFIQSPPPLEITDGALVHGSTIFLAAPTRVVDATLLAEEMMLIQLRALVISPGAVVSAPRVVLGRSSPGLEITESIATLAGDGVLNADCSNSGLIDPGAGAETATLRIDGSLTQSSHLVEMPESLLNESSPRPSGRGFLRIDIAGESDHDLLEVTGAALLGGTLRIDHQNGFAPSWGDAFTVLAAASIDGDFDDLDAPDPPPDLFYEVEYTDTTATLVVHHRLDIQRDGRIGAPDLAELLTVWGTGDDEADFTRDGVVDAADLGVLLGAWGLSAN